ncbi:Ribonuclease P protein subunit p29 [Oryzias melastigma]|uniref:Ribonuclease P protein subunit p29 n=1 Tax=Oryzias melastigma TaxID=30732 RepID=A0A834F3W6_ORYME|nr:Ribonuclease P protein subunit p29 [Oryzias melastigma]
MRSVCRHCWFSSLHLLHRLNLNDVPSVFRKVPAGRTLRSCRRRFCSLKLKPVRVRPQRSWFKLQFLEGSRRFWEWSLRGAPGRQAFTEAFLASSLQQPDNQDLKNLLTHKAVILGYTRPKKQRTKRSSKKAKGLTCSAEEGPEGLPDPTGTSEVGSGRIPSSAPAGGGVTTVVSSAGTSSSCPFMTSGGSTSGTCAADSDRHGKPAAPRSSPASRVLSLCFSQQSSVCAAEAPKADLHGAIITVVRSKCPSYVGLSGILLQEFKHVFKIITAEDRLKVIPKRNSVFSVEIDGFVSHIFGSRFEQRASERSAKKFKVHGSIDL